jgi:hypothetical protein
MKKYEFGVVPTGRLSITAMLIAVLIHVEIAE